MKQQGNGHLVLMLALTELYSPLNTAEPWTLNPCGMGGGGDLAKPIIGLYVRLASSQHHSKNKQMDTTSHGNRITARIAVQKWNKRIIKEDKFMSTGWNSQQGEGKFAIQFETTHKDLYKLVEKACQNAMDEAGARKSAKGGCFENGNNHISNRENLGTCCSAN